jgi:hypothetical protein
MIKKKIKKKKKKKKKNSVNVFFLPGGIFEASNTS